MLKIYAKRGIFKEITEGKHRVHLVVFTTALARARIGDRVRLYLNQYTSRDVYIVAIRQHASLETLLNLEPWKQLTPEMRTVRQSHKALRRQYSKYEQRGFVVFEYELAPPTAPSAAT